MSEKKIARPELIEALAKYAQDAWSGWMEYLFANCLEDNGDMIIPERLVKRWMRQVKSEYSELPENEKESDRKEARQIIEIFERFGGAVVTVTNKESEK